MNESEQHLKKYFEKENIWISKIDTNSNRTPDFIVSIKGVECLFEVKEVSENPTEKISREEIKKNGEAHADSLSTKRRLKDDIADAADQFKKFGINDRPCVVVIMDCRSIETKSMILFHEIQEAMLGAKTFWKSTNTGETKVISWGDAALTHNRRNYISAVATLHFNESEGKQGLLFFHNPFATTKLPKDVFDLPNTKHFIAIEHKKNEFEWKEKM